MTGVQTCALPISVITGIGYIETVVDTNEDSSGSRELCRRVSLCSITCDGRVRVHTVIQRYPHDDEGLAKRIVETIDIVDEQPLTKLRCRREYTIDCRIHRPLVQCCDIQYGDSAGKHFAIAGGEDGSRSTCQRCEIEGWASVAFVPE